MEQGESGEEEYAEKETKGKEGEEAEAEENTDLK